MDAIPFVSQVKSLVLWHRGDTLQALATQHQFTQKCILIAPIRSLLEGHLSPEFGHGANLVPQACMVTGAFIGPVLVLFGIRSLGFTAGGIAKHSWASYWQHRSGSGSLFSWLQRTGATGLTGWATACSALVFAILFAVLAVLVVEFYTQRNTSVPADESLEQQEPLLVRVPTPASMD